MIELSPFYLVIISVFSLLSAALISWGVTKATIKYNSERIKLLSKKIEKTDEKVGLTEEKLEGKIFNGEHQPLYVPLKRCLEQRDRCQLNFEENLKSVRADNKEDHKSLFNLIEINKNLVIEQQERIFKSIGEVKGMIRAHLETKE